MGCPACGPAMGAVAHSFRGAGPDSGWRQGAYRKTRRLANINSVVLSLYSRGMTTRDIEAHLEEVYGASVSRELISNVTEVVVDEIKAWQARPLDEVYPILYVDGLRLRIKDNGVVTTKVAYLA